MSASIRRFPITVSLALLTILAAPAAQAQPANRPVRIIVGFAAGGGTDILARFAAEKLRGVYAPNIIVENRVGASARIAVTHVRDSEPDGGTILMSPDFVFVVYPHSYKNLEYDVLRDFIPAATLSRSNLVVSVGAAVP